MKKQLAVYDLDLTLCEQDSYVLFYRFLKKRGLVSLCATFTFYTGFVMSLFGVSRGGGYIRSVLVFSLIKKSRFGVREVIRDFVADMKFRPELLKCIKEQSCEGLELVLLTAAPLIYAAQIGKRLGFNRVIASRCSHSLLRHGRLLLGARKKDELCCVIDLDACDLAASIGYGNHDDLCWLELFGSYKKF